MTGRCCSTKRDVQRFSKKAGMARIGTLEMISLNDNRKFGKSRVTFSTGFRLE